MIRLRRSSRTMFRRGPCSLTSSCQALHLLHGKVRVTIPRAIPLHLQAEYCLLQLPAEASLADVRKQYRELAKLYHPDAGGDHTDFLALQQAYEQVVEYLHTRR